MATRVYKYQLPITIMFDQSQPLTVNMPSKARVLSTRFVIPNRRPEPNEAPPLFIWALVETDDKMALRQFYVIGTGRDIPDENLEFHGTALCEPTHEVFHVFERISNRSLREGLSD